MGQQQLLLLVLGIVIVGIAVVAGIQAFSEGKAKAEQDAAVSDAMRIISDMQAWKLKPGAFGGGADLTSPSDFSTVSFKALGYPVGTPLSYSTYNGCYVMAIDGTAGASLNLYREGTTTVDPGTDATEGTQDDITTVDCDETTEVALVTITGPGTEHIEWDYTPGDA